MSENFGEYLDHLNDAIENAKNKNNPDSGVVENKPENKDEEEKKKVHIGIDLENTPAKRKEKLQALAEQIKDFELAIEQLNEEIKSYKQKQESIRKYTVGEEEQKQLDILDDKINSKEADIEFYQTKINELKDKITNIELSK
jgi:predicted RNase H-like nuclease (RuvC/YqgF family)